MMFINTESLPTFQSTICQTVLTGEAFTGCNAVVDVQSYIDACVQDLCSCDSSMTGFCICNNFAEYSRQCAHSGGQPLEWRTQDLCGKYPGWTFSSLMHGKL